MLHDDRDFDPMVSQFSLKTPTPLQFRYATHNQGAGFLACLIHGFFRYLANIYGAINFTVGKYD